MRAAVCHEFGAPLTIEEVRLDPPQAGEVTVRIAACAVCHSDITHWQGGWGGALPAVYGHEAAGVVETVGPGAVDLHPDDHVVVTLIRCCGHCHYCLQGRPVLCVGRFRLDEAGPLHAPDGTPIRQAMRTGAFAERVTVHASQVAAIPKDVPLEIGFAARLRRDHRSRCRRQHRPGTGRLRGGGDRHRRRGPEQRPGCRPVRCALRDRDRPFRQQARRGPPLRRHPHPQPRRRRSAGRGSPAHPGTRRRLRLRHRRREGGRGAVLRPARPRRHHRHRRHAGLGCHGLVRAGRPRRRRPARPGREDGLGPDRDRRADAGRPLPPGPPQARRADHGPLPARGGQRGDRGRDQGRGAAQRDRVPR